MAEELVKTEEEIAAEAEAAKAQAEADALALSNEIDYKALAEAEKARADAAEALIVKNKNIDKRTEPLTEERVLELITLAKENADSPEVKALEEAQRKLKELQGKNDEITRALKAKETTPSDPPTQHDPLPKVEPKLPEGSPLASYKHMGNGLYSKKLTTGKTVFINTKAQGNERKKWVE